MGIRIAVVADAPAAGRRRHPTRPATTITTTCAPAVRDASATVAATIASETRGRSGARLRAIPHTAWATTATATTFSPCSHPASATPSDCTPYANASIATADGNVNPSHAATPPSKPARMIPMAIDT